MTLFSFLQDYALELSDEVYGRFNFNWGYYLGSLKKLCETGRVLPSPHEGFSGNLYNPPDRNLIGRKTLTTRRFLAGLLWAAVGLSAAAQPFDGSLFSGMRWRMVGPFRAGRTVTAAGVPGEPDHFYFGASAAASGRARTPGEVDADLRSQPIASIGAIAVAPSNPNVVYVGSGEADMRSDISYGNGMYRSSDGGKTWTHVGSTDSRQIGRSSSIQGSRPRLRRRARPRLRPEPRARRLRSRDGGKTWKKVLFKDETPAPSTSPSTRANRRTILAALWRTRRPPWNVYPPSNGPGSGLYQSTDGGETWKRSRQRAARRQARAHRARRSRRRDSTARLRDRRREGGRPLRLATTAARRGARVRRETRIWGRGWYFGGVTVDPKNPDVVYVCNTAMYRSTDGGKTFVPIKGAPGGDDYHQLWIDPRTRDRMISASDQGAVVSVDGGEDVELLVQPADRAVLPRLPDNRFPYWIYGAQQDSGAAATPSRTDYATIIAARLAADRRRRRERLHRARSTDPRSSTAKRVGRFDWTRSRTQNVDPTLAYPGDYRGDWTLPLAISPRDRKALYFANQYVFRTADGGQHWAKISPDLTREAPAVPPNLDASRRRTPPSPGRAAASFTRSRPRRCATACSGRARTTASSGARRRGRALDERDAAGAHGVVQGRDPRGVALRPGDRVRGRGPPPPGRMQPYIYRTKDGGRTWAAVAHGIPAGSYVNAVREDPERRGPSLCGNGDRCLRLLRRRRPLAASADEPADLLGPRHLVSRRGRPRRRDARPLLLGPGRPRAAAAAQRKIAASASLALRAARGGPVHPATFQGTPCPEGRARRREPSRTARSSTTT